MEFTLTEENYYTTEADMRYMSVSQFKDFDGMLGRAGCEFRKMKMMSGEWSEQPSTAMLVGSYVDSYFEGSLPQFQMDHRELFNKDGSLKSYYITAETVIDRIKRDDYFMKFISGEKQKIMTGKIGGIPWKIKMDSYLPEVAIVDLKVIQSISQKHWVRDLGYVSFVEYWGYDTQGAVYQEIVRQNTGYKLPFYIAAASKEKEPDIEIIQVEQWRLDTALQHVESSLPYIMQVKNKEREPNRCECCDCCKHFKVLKKPILVGDIVDKF